MWPPTISIVQQSYNPPNFRMKSIWTSYWSTSLRLSTKLRVSTANRNKRFQSRLSSFTCINSSGIGTMSICQDNFIITTHPYQIIGLYPLARNLPPRYQTSEPASWSRQRDSQALWLWQRQASCSRGAKCVVHLLQILQVTSGNECDNICWPDLLHCRAPELIFGATDYTTNIDVWSAGCVFAGNVHWTHETGTGH